MKSARIQTIYFEEYSHYLVIFYALNQVKLVPQHNRP